MRRISFATLLPALLCWSIAFGQSQQAGINPRGVVDSAEISGIDSDEISQDLRDSVRRLIGQPFDQPLADALLMRLQSEKPEYEATVRLTAGDRDDRVNVIFFLEMSGAGGEPNVNSRYTVERVEIQGFDETKLSASIRDELQKLVGSKLDQDQANQVLGRLQDELRPRHVVSKRVVKGSDRQHIVVVYDIQGVRWIPFISRPQQHIVYHSKQNFSAAVNGNLYDNKDVRLYFGLASDQDRMIERFAGFNFGLETVKLGTERLGLALRYERYHERWQPSTVLADPESIYRVRATFEPSVTFAFDPRLRLTAGLNVTDLQMQNPEIHNSHSNSASGALIFGNTWTLTGGRHHSLDASYEVRSGARNLDSDFIYTRHVTNTTYSYRGAETHLLLRFSAGELRGNAPLYERFSLGDTTTLRGWNKFDITPAGGNRMAHASLQVGFGDLRNVIQKRGSGARIDVESDFHVFYDSGLVGDRGSPMKLRHAAGFGFGSNQTDGFFLEVGFPIRSSRIVPVFMMGFRF